MNRILKSLGMLLLCMLFVQEADAVPTNPRSFVVTQKDGTKLELRFVGDENYHYYCTMDGMALVKVDDAYYYATVDAEGNQVSSGMLAHEPEARSVAEMSFVAKYKELNSSNIKRVWQERLDVRNEQLEAKTRARRVRKGAIGVPTTYIGKKRGIVILVNFADRAMKTAYTGMTGISTRDCWDMQFNQVGYNKNNHIGSVRDYFLDQSYQQLEIDFDVVGPYTVSEGWQYYGKNRGDSNTDVHPCQLVSEACKLADPDVNFKDYDWDGDGEVDQVFVVFAGYSAAAGYSPDAIWPHEWHISYGSYYGDGNGALRLDGVKLDNYALSSELNGTSGSAMDPIGTAVHEFSHCLGLPDFYDVDGHGTQCMDYWDVLDAGCYSGPNWKGEAPTGYTAYERNFAGWLDFEELTIPRKITGLENLGDTPKAYIYYNKGNKNEYFILENRQAKKWFKYPVSAHGLFVYHVDYNKQLWQNDRPNSDANHPRMTYVPADKSFNRAQTSGMTADFFPGTKTVRSLTNTSHTAVYGKMFNKNSDGTYNMNMELTSIQEASGKITFTFNGGESKLKTNLTDIAVKVKAMLDVPHEDLTEGASAALLAAADNAQALIMNTSATSEELIEACDVLRQSAAEFITATAPTPGEAYDITFFIDNPEVKSNEAWVESDGNNPYDCSNSCAEYGSIKFNISQTLPYTFPVGSYALTCSGFQRTGLDENELPTAGTVYAQLYCRSNVKRLKNIIDDAQETRKSINDALLADNLYVPVNTRGANYYFSDSLYFNTLDFKLTSPVSGLKLGLKSTLGRTNYWTCFANFKLYYYGDLTETAIMNVKNENEEKTIYDVTGRKVANGQNLSRGIYIVNGKKIFIK